MPCNAAPVLTVVRLYNPAALVWRDVTQQILHIDFGDCFEVAMNRGKFPERIPFRLTRMLVNAMEVSQPLLCCCVVVVLLLLLLSFFFLLFPLKLIAIMYGIVHGHTTAFNNSGGEEMKQFTKKMNNVRIIVLSKLNCTRYNIPGMQFTRRVRITSHYTRTLHDLGQEIEET